MQSWGRDTYGIVLPLSICGATLMSRVYEAPALAMS